MSESGIVRKIDGLGRIVIPKEMRLILRIREGDPLSITEGNGGLYIKKYSPLTEVISLCYSLCAGISKLGKICVITDEERVICCSETENGVIGEKCSVELRHLIRVMGKERIYSDFKITENGYAINGGYFVPIVVNGQGIGSVVITGETVGDITDNESLCSYIAGILTEKFSV